MNLGFLSDTHGSLADTRRALEFLKGCQHIFHLGDVLYHGPRNDLPVGYQPRELAEFLRAREDISYVRGNCDSDVDQMVLGQDLSQKERVFLADGLGFYMVHGYEEEEEDRIRRAREQGLSVLVTGHSHRKVLEEREGLVFLNPGSTSLPKDGAKSVASYQDGVFRLWDLDLGQVVQELSLA